MIDEGYTKYECDWREAPSLPADAVEKLNAWRNRLHDQGLIGYYPEHGVGFGNLSIREDDSDVFIISGTQTGHRRQQGGRVEGVPPLQRPVQRHAPGVPVRRAPLRPCHRM